MERITVCLGWGFDPEKFTEKTFLPNHDLNFMT
jgi:hypothetical protein